MKQFDVFRGGKSKRIPEADNFRVETLEETEIEEITVFSREKVIDIIEMIARDEGLNAQHLEILHELYDTKAKLIKLSIKVTEGRAKGEGWGNIWYDYIIKGDHGEITLVDVTCIIRSYATIQEPTVLIAGGVVAEFIEDRWYIFPGDISECVRYGPKLDGQNIKD